MSTLTFKYPQKMTAKPATAPTSSRLFKASSPAETGAFVVFGPGSSRKSAQVQPTRLFHSSDRTARRQARRAGKAVL